MKKFLKTLCLFVAVASVCLVWCGVCTSCSSSKDTMYQPKQRSSKVIHSNYKVRGNNNSNSSTYRTY